MKKPFIMLSIVATILTLSCKKDRACSCHTSVTTSYGNAEVTTDTVFTDVSKKDAETRCNALDENVSTYYGSVVTTCDLK